MKNKGGFFLLELIPTLTVVAFMLTIVILAINPFKQFQKVRNTSRKHDVSQIADAIVEHSRDNGRSLILNIPREPAVAVEICGDIETGSCTNLLDLSPLIGTYLDEVPIDPRSSDPDRFNEHSRYFIVRTQSEHIVVSAPDTEPEGDEDIAVTR
jgi:type II secretory pathway pseudopilin PulG